MVKKVNDMDADELIFKLISEKVGSVDPEEIFFAKAIDAGPNAGKYSALLGGKKITSNQLTNLQQEALLLSSMEIWKIFTNTLRHEAELRMLRLAKNERDMDWGKAIMHSVGVFEHIVKAIRFTLVEEQPKQMGKK